METSGGSNSGSGLVLSYGSLKQIKILQSGCQRSNRNILHCAGDRFAYCAALTVNMYNLSSHKLEKIIHVHSKQIAGMSFSRSNPDVFVTCSDDLTAKRWNVNELKELATVDLPSPPCMIEWCHVGDSVAVLLRSGHVYMWNEGKSLELIAALGDCVRIRWDYKRGDNYTPRLAAAQRNGTLAIWDKATSTVSKILITSDRTSVTGLISDLQWDPTSNKYVLVSFEEGNMFLADVDQKIVQTEYLSEKQVMMTAFVHKDGGGGDFLTIDSDLPNVSVWNVSRPIARSRFRVGDKRCAIVSIKSLDLDNYPRHIALAFADGSTGLYNLGAPEGGKFVFLSQPAHSETVFDCQFKPGAPDIFATASNDGSLRIWDLSTMECLNDFTSTEVLYAASWCPGDEDEHRIVTASITGALTIWDTKEAKMICRFRHHNGPSYRIRWNPCDPNLICSTSADMTAVVFQARDPANPTAPGHVLRRYQHPNMVYGCDWSRFSKNLLATGCHDGAVRVFDTSSTDARALHTFIGHRERVFNVEWSPLLPGVIASGSDDRTVRVWKISAPAEAPIILNGHTENIRGLAWSWEVPFLLFSGSWAGVIKVWDIRKAICLQTLHEHHADVYGIVSHPNRPFSFLSCSRDTSLRVWSATDCFAGRIHLETVLDQGLLRSTAVGDIKAAMHPYLQRIILCGRRSQAIMRECDDLKESEMRRQALFFDFFSVSPGVRQFFELLECIITNRACDHDARIQHVNDLWKVQYTLARQMQASDAPFGSGTKTERLKRAAEMFLLLGCLKQYCDILIDIGQWTHAIALAPAVSASYWKNACERYADVLMEKKDPQALSFLVASGNIPKMIEYQLKCRRQSAALISAVTQAMEKFPDLSELPLETKEEEAAAAVPIPVIKSVTNEKIVEEEENEEEPEARDSVEVSPVIIQVIIQQAQEHLALQQPILAACCYLAAGEQQAALSVLLLGDEILLAQVLVQCLNMENCDYVFVETSKRCEQYGMWDDALALLQKIDNSGPQIQLLAARCDKPSHEKLDFYGKANLPRKEAVLIDAEVMLKEGKKIDALTNLLCGGDEQKAIELAFELLHELLNKPSWSLNELEALVEPLNSVQAQTLPQALKCEVLIYSCLLGCQRAYTFGFGDLAAFLGDSVINLCTKGAIQCPVPPSFLKMQELTYFAGVDPVRALNLAKDLLNSPTLPSKLKPNVTAIKKTIETVYTPGSARLQEINSINPALPQFPSCGPDGVPAISVISRKPVLGFPVMLEDGISYVSLAEARMLLKCTPFSPLFSGFRFSFDGVKRLE